MKILSKTQILNNLEYWAGELRKKTFIHPTDTVYGIGCDATSYSLVKKIREIRRTKQPFNIIVPDKEWIRKNTYISHEQQEYLSLLPGPYTLILRLKPTAMIATNVNPLRDGTIGVRIIDHWFQRVVKAMNTPIVSTMAVIDGWKVRGIEDYPQIPGIDYFINAGYIDNNPSTIIDLTKPEVVKRERREARQDLGMIIAKRINK